MGIIVQDTAKRRLTERRDLVTAVEFLMANGIARQDIGEQLARYYYVDIDLLNDVLARSPAEVAPRTVHEKLRRVA